MTGYDRRGVRLRGGDWTEPDDGGSFNLDKIDLTAELDTILSERIDPIDLDAILGKP